MSAARGDLDRVLERTGATYRQLDYWCRQGYLSPGTPGTGAVRDWPESEIRAATAMARLTAVGISPGLAARVARAGGSLEVGPGVYISLGDPGGGLP
jgi:hypothetical protein